MNFELFMFRFIEYCKRIDYCKRKRKARKTSEEERTGQLEEENMFLAKSKTEKSKINLFILRRGRDNGKEKTYLQKGDSHSAEVSVLDLSR